MDFNIRIIEGVKRFPSLYECNCSLEEREKFWMQLAEQLEVPAQMLKVRWHSLLHSYHRDVNFRYANKLRFVYRRTERSTEVTGPEFIITEECLKEEVVEDQERFVLLNTEELDNNLKSFNCPKEIESDFKQSSEQKKEILIKDVENDNQTDANAEKVEEAGKAQSENVKMIPFHKSNECDNPSVIGCAVEEKKATVTVEENNEIYKKNTREVYNEKSQIITERCEDVIFGELVSAMLKRMDEDKKKNIKREIMNILFA